VTRKKEREKKDEKPPFTRSPLSFAVPKKDKKKGKKSTGSYIGSNKAISQTTSTSPTATSPLSSLHYSAAGENFSLPSESNANRRSIIRNLGFDWVLFINNLF
jgi:hypothetical protein